MKISGKNILILSLLCINHCIAMASHVPIIECVTLEDGTIYEGYVSKQEPGKSYSFKVAKAQEKVVDTLSIEITDYEVAIDELDAEWLNWIDDNPESVQYREGKRIIILSNIKFGNKKNDDVNRVRVLETGTNYIKYIRFPFSHEVEIAVSKVKSIERVEKLTSLDLYGIEETVNIKGSQNISGQIAFQMIGKWIKVLDNNGVYHTISLSKIEKISREGLNKDRDLLSQAQVFDKIILKDDLEDVGYTGVIVEQVYGGSKKGNYIIIKTKDGFTKRIESSNISRIEKVINPQFEAKKDVYVRKGELRIGEDIIKPISVIYGRDDVLTISATQKPIEVKVQDEKIVIVTRIADDKNLILIPINTAVKSEGIIEFTYKDIVENSINPSDSECTINGNRYDQFVDIKRGKYVLMNHKTNRNSNEYFYIEVK